MSCLQALDHLKTDHPIIAEILSKGHSQHQTSTFTVLAAGHVGIRCNKHADRAAKT